MDDSGFNTTSLDATASSPRPLNQATPSNPVIMNLSAMERPVFEPDFVKTTSSEAAYERMKDSNVATIVLTGQY